MCVKAAGLVSAQLKPRSVKSFWEKPVDTPEVCQARHDFYEQRRLENWALVLHEKPGMLQPVPCDPAARLLVYFPPSSSLV